MRFRYINVPWTLMDETWTKHGRSMDKRLYYRLCVLRRIDTWQIVYLLYEDACPKISIHKNEI